MNLYQSFAQTDPERLKLIETLGGTKLQAFTKVVFPGNIPTFISLSKVNIGLALVGVIIGEFLAGRKGLGYLIIYGSQVFKLDMVILSIVILCVIAMVIYGLLNLLEKKISYTGRFHLPLLIFASPARSAWRRWQRILQYCRRNAKIKGVINSFCEKGQCMKKA